MITIKSDREITLMKEAGRIVALAHQEVEKHVKAGVTTLELDQIVEKVIRDNDATPSFKGYGGFPGSACTSVNDQVVHGIPSNKVTLKDGDIISIDIGALYKGYHGDSAWTYPVGTIDDDVRQLLEVTKQLGRKSYWNRTNVIEFWAFSTKLSIIIPGLLFGIQFWWLYIFALVSSLALILTSTVKTLPTIIYFNVGWSILATAAIVKHFI